MMKRSVLEKKSYLKEQFYNLIKMSFHPSIYGSLYARNFDMTVSGCSQFHGDINVESDRIIYINGNTLHTFNKTRRSVYTIENQRVAIPFSIEGSSSVNICLLYTSPSPRD